MTQERLNRQHRQIIKRIIVRGTLLLDTPTCLSNGDSDDSIDLMLLRDGLEDKALLTGSSIAGALRNYVREYGGYESADDSRLFGCQRTDVEGDQSPLIIYDALSRDNLKAELRDGVKINSITGTAEKGAKYDLELLEAGTEFYLCFELIVDRQDKNEYVLVKELAIALSGLEQGKISLGMKKRRGFGRCHVKEWQVWNFYLRDANERIAWLNFEHWHTGLFSELPSYSSIQEAFTQANLAVDFDKLAGEDKRDRFTINATFSLASPLLIRSGHAETGRAPDVVHLKSHRNGELKPILSGTSLAGVLRHRAESILNTLEKPTTIIDEIFGLDFSEDKTKEAKASRLIVHESTINHTTDLVQTRIAIDRFTGGAYHGALFQEQPVFAKDETELKLEIELRNPIEHEIGLLLLLLKDLWTEDLPVGGGSSVGRGRLKGKKATMTWKDSTWEIKQNDDDSLNITPNNTHDQLQNYVSELANYLKNYLKENNNNEPSNS